MPILTREPDCFPPDLLDEEAGEHPWWLLYIKSRQEKAVMRALANAQVPHYGPIVPKRYKSPAGRVRTSYIPLFSTYVFLRGDDVARHEAICTGHVLQAAPIRETEQLVADLRQIRDLIAINAPLTVESRIEVGQKVRVRNGVFAGFEGVAIRRDGATRLLVVVNFMDRGVSVKLDDCQVDPI